MWHVMVGLHDSIAYSFLPVGHTKFAPDWCFGLLKQRYRYTKVDGLDDFATMVESSANCNSVQLVGKQDGEVIVKHYDWNVFLSPHFKRLEGIKKYQHFILSSPGKVEAKVRHDDKNIIEFNLLTTKKWKPSLTDLPPAVTPKGLTSTRQWYLYDKIREYCSDSAKDQVCPLPLVSRESGTDQYQVQSPPPSPSLLPPPSKKSRVCGKCGLSGHNRRSCNN